MSKTIAVKLSDDELKDFERLKETYKSDTSDMIRLIIDDEINMLNEKKERDSSGGVYAPNLIRLIHYLNSPLVLNWYGVTSSDLSAIKDQLEDIDDQLNALMWALSKLTNQLDLANKLYKENDLKRNDMKLLRNSIKELEKFIEESKEEQKNRKEQRIE